MATRTVSSPASTGKALYQQMIAKADQDLAQLHKQEQEAHRSLAQAEQEQRVFAQRAIARSDQLQTAQGEVARLQEAVEQKRVSVSIAEGTGAHSDLLSELQRLEKSFQKATPQLQEVQARVAREGQADASKYEGIEAIVQREQGRLAQIAGKQASIAAARDRAHEDLGQAGRVLEVYRESRR